MSITLRPLTRAELDPLVELCAEHAAYERATYSPNGKRDALASYFFADPPRATCLLAATPNGLAGYTTWSREFSTWEACEYLHMDCLYLRPAWRGRGIGARMLQRLVADCAAAGLAHLEWQSPLWNQQALRFYQRQGATLTEKARLRLSLQPRSSTPQEGLP